MKRYLLIAFSLFMLSVHLNAGSWNDDNSWSNPNVDIYFGEAPSATPSDNFYNSFQQDTYGSPILRAMGDDDDEDDLNEGGDAGSKDPDANDVPIGDGMLVFVLSILFYVSIILLRSFDRHSKVFKGFELINEHKENE